MKVIKVLMLMLISMFILCVFNNGYAEELLHEEQIIEPTFEKIYISPDQILIYPESIFYLNEVGEVVPVRLIASDVNGLYIVKQLPRRCSKCRLYVNSRTNQCQNIKCEWYGR